VILDIVSHIHRFNLDGREREGQSRDVEGRQQKEEGGGKKGGERIDLAYRNCYETIAGSVSSKSSL